MIISRINYHKSKSTMNIVHHHVPWCEHDSSAPYIILVASLLSSIAAHRGRGSTRASSRVNKRRPKPRCWVVFIPRSHPSSPAINPPLTPLKKGIPKNYLHDVTSIIFVHGLLLFLFKLYVCRLLGIYRMLQVDVLWGDSRWEQGFFPASERRHNN